MCIHYVCVCIHQVNKIQEKKRRVLKTICTHMHTMIKMKNLFKKNKVLFKKKNSSSCFLLFFHYFFLSRFSSFVFFIFYIFFLAENTIARAIFSLFFYSFSFTQEEEKNHLKNKHKKKIKFLKCFSKGSFFFFFLGKIKSYLPTHTIGNTFFLLPLITL